MKKSVSWVVPVAAIGSAIFTAATLLQYMQAHRAAQSGGHLPIMVGAVAIGALTTLCSYFIGPKSERSFATASLLGAFASVIFAGVLIVTLIKSFGS